MAWLDAEPWLARATDRPSMETVLGDVRARGWAVALETDAHRSVRGSVNELLDELDQDQYQVVGPLDTERTYDVVMIAAPVFGPRRESLP